MEHSCMLVNAIRAALREQKLPMPDATECDYEALMKLALQHKLQPLVMDTIYCSVAATDWSGLEANRRFAKQQMLGQAVRTQAFLSVYAELRAAGVHPLVVKGAVCRTVWPKGDLRISADEDLYVCKDEFKKACEILQKNGLKPMCDWQEMLPGEIGWRRMQDGLYIELHQRLFDNNAFGRELEAQFQSTFEHAREYQMESGQAVLSMGPDDHMLYLLLHAFKHFVGKGFGIRQVCDIGLWAKTYGEELNWKMLFDRCRQVNALKFSAAVFQIAQSNLGIELMKRSDEWDRIEVDSSMMLEDLLGAGIYGLADPNMEHAASVTKNAVNAHKTGKRGGVLRAAFPPVSYLRQDYPVLKKYPVLLPAVWGIRFFRYLKETKETDSSVLGSLQLADERKALLRAYDILP